MNILLLSMPDSFEHTPSVAIRMPNGALASLAGNLDGGHRAFVADLILARNNVRAAVERLLAEYKPQVVGLSVMTFQRHTALGIAQLVRRTDPRIRIVAGGYDPSLAPEAYSGDAPIDFIVRGEGELTLRALVNAIDSGSEIFETIPGLSYRTGGLMQHNTPRPVSHLGAEIRLPDRRSRVLTGYTFLGRQVDVVETSRGCTYDCSFCSIIEMRGRNFHTFPIDRVMADIADARRDGARTIFLVDDNITLNVRRFRTLCDTIAAAGFDDVDYIVQAMTSSIAEHGDALAAAMKRAGIRYVFLGIENVVDTDLAFLRARAKNARREGGRAVENASVRAIETLHRHGMYVVGGLIVGNPDDTREAIDANLAFARRYVDWPYIQHPTPYPGTPMTRAFEARDLIVNRDPACYDGTTAVVRGEHLNAEDIEFMRWRAERWMKVRHMPVAFRHDPWFVLKHWHRMLRHTFRGSTWRSVLGLDTAEAVFQRYRAIRRSEREYLDGPAWAPPVIVSAPERSRETERLAV